MMTLDDPSHLSNSVLEVRGVESLSEESHVGVMVLVNLIGELHQLQSHVHQALIGELILSALLGSEGGLLEVGIDQVHLHHLHFGPFIPGPGNPSHKVLKTFKIHSCCALFTCCQ